jgi:hypothetical protein
MGCFSNIIVGFRGIPMGGSFINHRSYALRKLELDSFHRCRARRSGATGGANLLFGRRNTRTTIMYYLDCDDRLEGHSTDQRY